MKVSILIAILFSFVTGDAGAQVVPDPINEDSTDIIFTKVEQEADFPGGVSAWRDFLQKNLKTSVPVKNRAPAGTYKVQVRFIVAKDGTISNVTAETRFGYGMEAEVVRVIKKGPRWKPAFQNGRAVKAYRLQPVTFIISEG